MFATPAVFVPGLTCEHGDDGADVSGQVDVLKRDNAKKMSRQQEQSQVEVRALRQAHLDELALVRALHDQTIAQHSTHGVEPKL
jgi:hypothetical protein